MDQGLLLRGWHAIYQKVEVGRTYNFYFSLLSLLDKSANTNPYFGHTCEVFPSSVLLSNHTLFIYGKGLFGRPSRHLICSVSLLSSQHRAQVWSITQNAIMLAFYNHDTIRIIVKGSHKARLWAPEWGYVSSKSPTRVPDRDKGVAERRVREQNFLR